MNPAVKKPSSWVFSEGSGAVGLWLFGNIVPGSPVPPSRFTLSEVVAGLCCIGNIVPGSCDSGLFCFGQCPGVAGDALFFS